MYLAQIILFAAIVAWLYWRKRGFFLELLRDIRPFRMLHYQLMFVLGAILADNSFLQILTTRQVLLLLSALISIFLACLFSLITNNFADIEIDRVSNSQRPLVTGQVDEGLYKKTAWAAFFLSLLYASLIGGEALLFVALFILGYYLYSIPPFRLKRIPVLSKLLLSANSLFLVYLGFTFAGARLPEFPLEVLLFFLVAYTAVVNFIDIKDYAGDKKAGIQTLPVLLGENRAKLLIAACFLAAHCLAFLAINDSVAVMSIVLLGAVQFRLIFRENYKERPVLIVYMLTLLLLLFCFALPGVRTF